MKRTVFTFSILYFFALSIAAQDWTWAKNYGADAKDHASSVGSDYNGNVYITGYDTYQSGGSCTECYYKELFYKFDKDGNLIWKKELPYQGSKLVTDSLGNSYIAASGYLMKYDANGNQLWASIDNTIAINTLALHPLGGVAISGAIAGQKGVIARYDANGNKLWESKRDFYHYIAGNVSVNKVGDISFCGGYKADTNTYNKGVNIILDAMGNLKSFFTLPNSGYCLLGKDGVYLLKSGGDFEAESGIELENGFLYHLLKYSLTGELLWHQRFKSSSGAIYKFIGTLDKNDNIITALNYARELEVENEFSLSNTGARDMVVIKFNPQGIIDWNQKSSGNGVVTPYGVVSGYGNEIFITGDISKSQTFGGTSLDIPNWDYGDLFIAKISQNLVGIKEGTTSQMKNDLIVKPNPSNGTFNVNYKGNIGQKIEIKMLNVLGSVIYSETVDGFTGTFDKTLDLHLTQGTYFVLIQNSERQEVKKVIIQ